MCPFEYVFEVLVRKRKQGLPTPDALQYSTSGNGNNNGVEGAEEHGCSRPVLRLQF